MPMVQRILLISALAISAIAWGQDLDALKAEIQGKQPKEMRTLIIRRFGSPVRVFGSGVQTEQWDVEGGFLSFDFSGGPRFDKGGFRTWLLLTNNPLALCLFGHYEMTTRPETPNRTTYCLGDLYLSWGYRYMFTAEGRSSEHRQGQANNFFVLRPSGRVQVKYASGMTAATRLEDLPDGTLVATLTFLARNWRSSQVCRVITDRTSRQLELEGESTSFRLERSWVNLWR